jgi:hypothetical protein
MRLDTFCGLSGVEMQSAGVPHPNVAPFATLGWDSTNADSNTRQSRPGRVAHSSPLLA